MQIFLEKRLLGMFFYMGIDFSANEVLIIHGYHSCNTLESRRTLRKM